MKTSKLQTTLGAAGLLLTAVSLLLLPQAAAQAAKSALDICAGTLLPSLFPYFVLTELWVRLGIAGRMGRAAGPMMAPLFHLPGAAAPALLLGAIGGYPVGAQAVCRLHAQGLLTRQEAEDTLSFCNNAGPAFVLGVVGGGLFQSAAVGAALWAIHLATALAIGVLLRPARRPGDAGPAEEAPALSFGAAFPQAVRQAGVSFFSVCLYVIFFSVLTNIITRLLPQAVTASGLYALLLGAVELAGGTARLQELTWPASIQFAAAAALLGFGGLCVQMQIRAILAQAGLSGRSLLRGKALHALLSGAVALCLGPLLPLPEPCLGSGGNAAAWYWLPGLFAAVCLLGLLWGRHTKIPSGNRGEYGL